MRKHGWFLALAFAFVLVLGSGCGGNGGSAHKTTASEPPPRKLEAPIDAKMLPYYNASWTFTMNGGEIGVQTDLYRDNEGREFGWTVCTHTWYSYPNDDIMVLAADGGPLAHKFGDEPCKKG